jgi:hypothetical protein
MAIGKLFSRVEIVPLQTNEQILLANCDGVIQDPEGAYFVLDAKFASLMKFDKDGQFLFKVGNLGRGPGEFQGISDFNVDFVNEEIIVYSSEDISLFIYDLNGVFLRSTKLNFYSSNFEMLGDSRYAFYIDYNRSDVSGLYNVLITDVNGKVQERLMPFPSSVAAAVSFSGFFNSFNDVSIYNNAFSDTLVVLDNNLNAEEFLIFNFEGAKWDYGFDFNKIYTKRAIDLSYIMTRTYIDDRFLFSTYMYKRRIRSMIYDRNTEFVYNEFKLSNDFLFKLIKTPQSKTRDGKYLTSLSAQSYQSLVRRYPEQWLNFKNEYPRLEEKLLGILKTDNNPVLITYEINK